MRIKHRICRLEVAIPPVTAEQSNAAFQRWARALDDAASRRAVGAETDEDRELLTFIQDMAHENR